METQHVFYYAELAKLAKDTAFLEEFKTDKETLISLDEWLLSIRIIHQKRLNPLEFEHFHSMEPGNGILLFLGLKKESFLSIFLENSETNEVIYILPGDSVLNYPDNLAIFFFIQPHILPQRYRTVRDWNEVTRDED